MGYATVSVGDGTNGITADGNNNTIATAGGSDTVTLSGWNNVINAGSGLTTVTGGYANVYNVTALGTAGGVDVTDFNANYGDVLNLTGLESSLATGWTLAGVIDATDPTALDVSITTAGGATYQLATLHGVDANATLASLQASHNILG